MDPEPILGMLGVKKEDVGAITHKKSAYMLFFFGKWEEL